MLKKIINATCLTILGLIMVACSSGPELMHQPMPKSGFLPNYNLLQFVPDTPKGTRVWRYRVQGLNPNSYTAVILDPIFLNQSPTKNISPESLEQAKKALQESMVAAVLAKENISIVTQPGPSVAIISVGITGAEASADRLKPWSFTPIGLAANAAAYAAGVNAKTPALVIESRITDSESNFLLGEGLITIEGESFRTASGSIESLIEMAKKAVAEAVKLSVSPSR